MPSLLRLLSPKPVAKPPGVQRDAIPFVLSDGRRIDVLRVRDPRAKRLRLSVGERGARLTLPLRASLVSGERFLHEHRDWLTVQLARSGDDVAPLVRGESDALPLRGERLPLRWAEGRYARVVREAGEVTLQLDAEVPPEPAAAAGADPPARAVLAMGLAGARRHADA
jgi:predicted metal-dependent hydrolase